MRTLLLILALCASPALAHSQKERTIPADGSSLTAAPEVIRMEFNAPMRLTLLTLTNDVGDDMPVARTKDLKPAKLFEAAPMDLPAGRYTVDWRGLADDGHPMQGQFSFEITD